MTSVDWLGLSMIMRYGTQSLRDFIATIMASGDEKAIKDTLDQLAKDGEKF